MNRQDFIQVLCALYGTRPVKKVHCYRVVDGKLVPVKGYSFVVTEGGARFLVKWAAPRSKQHQWCCLNEPAVRLAQDLANLTEEIKPCGLISYSDWLELKRSSQSVQQVVQATAQPASEAK